MNNHVCGGFDQTKRAGCCTCCGEPVYEIKAFRADSGHPLDGHPVRVGPMLDHGTQVEFLLSDGSEIDVAMCFDCATSLRPAMYQRLWRACIDRQRIAMELAGKSPNEIAVALARLEAVWPIGLLRKRREAEGMLVVDRRG